jgi:hypothetical protein
MRYRYRFLALALFPLLLAAGAKAASIREYDGICKALTKEGDRAADFSTIAPTSVSCEAAILMRSENGVAVLTAGNLTGGDSIGFGSSNFQLKTPGKVIAMPVDTIHVGTEPGVDATGTCLFSGADIGKATTISCNATVVSGSRKKLIGVEIHVASIHVIQAK